MRIIDLQPEHHHLYHVCLEDWSDEMKEAGDHKDRWHELMTSRGLRVKIAVDKSGEPGGMIQYIPIEETSAEGKGLYMVLCIWVHGYKQGRGDYRRHGMGRALLEAAEADARSLGAAGMAAWGLAIPVWMKASWFRRYGYKKADRDGMRMLVWKPFTPDATQPRWVRERKRPERDPSGISVIGFVSGWCPAMNITYERAKRATEELGVSAHFRTIDTNDRATFREWGIADQVFLNGKPLQSGPPPSYEKIKRKIARRSGAG
jgi:GNAT superfamily N-acetyltransferase